VILINSHTNSNIFSFLASLCNACGLRFQWKLAHEKRIPPNNDPQPISIASLLNPVELNDPENTHQKISEPNVQ